MTELMDVVISTHGLSTTSRWTMERKVSRQEIVMAESQLISQRAGVTGRSWARRYPSIKDKTILKWKLGRFEGWNAH